MTDIPRELPEKGVTIHAEFQHGEKVYRKNQTSRAAGTVVSWQVDGRGMVDYQVAFGEAYNTYMPHELTSNFEDTEAFRLSLLGYSDEDEHDE